MPIRPDTPTTRHRRHVAWRRWWRPDLKAFWMTLLFNGASSGLVLIQSVLALQGAMQILLLLLALGNSGLGLWWLKRLWQAESGPA